MFAPCLSHTAPLTVASTAAPSPAVCARTQLVLDLRSASEVGDALRVFSGFSTVGYNGCDGGTTATAAAPACTAGSPTRVHVPLLGNRTAFIRGLLGRLPLCMRLRLAWLYARRRMEAVRGAARTRGRGGATFDAHRRHSPHAAQLTALAVEQLNRGGVQLLYELILQSAAPEVAAAMRALAAAHGPTAIFCAAGKDRTGVVTALVLACCGVSDEAIVADYVRRARQSPASREHEMIRGERRLPRAASEGALLAVRRCAGLTAPQRHWAKFARRMRAPQRRWTRPS